MNYLIYNLTKFEYDCSPKGSECVFVTHALHVGDAWYGIKVYPTARARDAAYRMQSKFARKGLAPPVGSHVLVMSHHRGRGKKPVRMHGYYTGMVRRLSEGYEYDWEMRKLLDRLEKEGLEIHDLGENNVGYWLNSLVCIDFGEISETGGCT